MFCKNCGKEMKDGSAFCAECGTMTESSNVKQVSSEMPVSNTNTSVISPEMPKKKYPVKLVIGAIIAVIIIIVVACAVGGSNDGEENSLIIENDECQLGATYDITPNKYIDRYNSIFSKLGGDSSLYLPSIDEWTVADLSEDGNTTYVYAVSNELIYSIYTYQDDKVIIATSTLGDSLIGNGVLYMTVMECASLGIDDKDIIDAMYKLFNEKIHDGYATFCYHNSVLTVSGNDIRIGAVSDEVLNTMEYYSISDSELE